jgi:hypothetical protein
MLRSGIANTITKASHPYVKTSFGDLLIEVATLASGANLADVQSRQSKGCHGAKKHPVAREIRGTSVRDAMLPGVKLFRSIPEVGSLISQPLMNSTLSTIMRLLSRTVSQC